MSEQPQIIQNAVYVKSTNTFHKSINRHDWVQFDTNDGKHFIDGGNDYIRCDFLGHPDIERLVLYDDSSLEELTNLLWLTYGKSGEFAPRGKYVRLKDCESSHLENILLIPNLNPTYKRVIEYLLKI